MDLYMTTLELSDGEASVGRDDTDEDDGQDAAGKNFRVCVHVWEGYRTEPALMLQELWEVQESQERWSQQS